MTDFARTWRKTLMVEGTSHGYYSLLSAQSEKRYAGLAHLPFPLRLVAENLLRHADRPDVEAEMLAALALRIRRTNGTVGEMPVRCRIDTRGELDCYRYGGLLPQVYRAFVARARG